MSEGAAKSSKDKNVTEDTVDLSKKTLDGGSIETPQHKNGLIDEPVKGEPLENYDERLAGDVLESMHDVAVLSAGNAMGAGEDVSVSAINDAEFDDGSTVRWFTISSGDKAYALYIFGNELFYRPQSEFDFIFAEAKDGMDSGFGTGMFRSRVDDPTEPVQGINVRRREDCLFVVDSVFGSLVGKSYNKLPVSVNDSVNENIRIRRHNKLGTDGDFSKSIAASEAKYKSDEDRKFGQEVEDAQKKGEVVGCLDNNQQESVKIRMNTHTVNETPVKFKSALPNKARYTKVEEGFDLEKARTSYGPKTRTKTSPIDGEPFNGQDYIWEPGDYVIFRVFQQYGPDEKKDVEWAEYRGQVTGAVDDIENGQIVTILCQGHTVEVLPIDIRPDMTIRVQRNRFANCKSEPRLGSAEGMGINPETRLTDRISNDPEEYAKQYRDFNNEKHFLAYLAKDGNVVSMDRMRVSLKDVSESRKTLLAMNEDRLIEVPVTEIVTPEEEWPWAVVVDGDADRIDGDAEPLRKVRVEPASYVEADSNSDGPEGLVTVILNGTKTRMMKKNIKILS